MTDPTPEPDNGNTQRFELVFEASASVTKADGTPREDGEAS